MRIIDWNICCQGNISKKTEFLKSLLADNSCIFLQEVKPHSYDYIKETLGNDYNIIYSLNHRKPSKYDSDARKLGVAILLNRNTTIEDFGVINRSPFPDRTCFATINVNGKTLKLLALHSLTGCGYYKAKSVQYDSFAEFTNEYQPDIIGIDANEPQIDHYDINQMQFFDNGPGAKNFFSEISSIGLSDAYVKANNINEIVESKYLTKSHNVRRKGAVRYDFIFVRNTFKTLNTSYNYDDAIASGSDHAVIVCDIEI